MTLLCVLRALGAPARHVRYRAACRYATLAAQARIAVRDGSAARLTYLPSRSNHHSSWWPTASAAFALILNGGCRRTLPMARRRKASTASR